MESSQLNKWQKGLLYVLYVLIILMVVFSFLAIRNKGEQGFQQCIQDKCDAKGEEFCTKSREIYNCCLGASGKISGGSCVFD